MNRLRSWIQVKTLGSYELQGRDNNFNLIRFVAAALVIYSHSYPLASGTNAGDPATRYILQTLGGVAVEVFFVISGFLVARSLMNNNSLGRFFLARMLRIYPAYIVAIIFTVFVVGAYFTEIPLSDYLINPEVREYLTDHLFLFRVHQHHSLPGVFNNLPHGPNVNGSLWTLPWEFWMYISITVAAVIGLIKQPYFAPIYSFFAYSVYIANTYLNFLNDIILTGGIAFSAIFYTGASYYLYRDRIPLDWKILALAIALLCIIPVSLHIWFILIFIIVLTYGVFVFAYILDGKIRHFNQLGDYSYGLYIYAYPVQQGLVSLIDGITSLVLFASSFSITLLLAIISWHLIEKPALGLKKKNVLMQNTAGKLTS